MSEKTLIIDSLKGLDVSSSIYNVTKNHFIDMQNLICEGGVNHKRKGFTERAKVSNATINGIWQFVEDGAEVYIVHAGKKLYKVILGMTAVASVVTELDLPVGANVDDSPSYGLVDKKNLYIFCGDYLYYAKENGAYKLLLAQNNKEFTYIPTTTISIDSEGVVDKVRKDFEAPNMLTKWRINTMQGVNGENTELNRTYYLDTEIEETSEVEVTVETVGKKEIYKNTLGENGKYGNKLYDNLNNEKATIYCSIGKIVFNNLISSSLGQEDNIKVLFACSAIGYGTRIRRCTFGALFGLRGNNDRLFISGNTEYPNYDFNSASNDFTYFQDKNYTIFGSSSSSITGYSRINDGGLGVHKSKGDSSGIYYRSSTTETITDSATGATSSETIFPITAGAIGAYCVSSRACARLGSDTLFLSESGGVCGLTIGANMVINERYAKERNVNIVPKIKERIALNKAIATTLDNRCYLFIDNCCFIADMRYKYAESKLNDDTYNYEWWLWKFDKNISSVYNTGSSLLLCSNDGSIFTQNEKFEDIFYEIYDTAGNMTIDYSTSTVTLSQELNKNIFKVSETPHIILNCKLSGRVVSGNKEFVIELNGIDLTAIKDKGTGASAIKLLYYDLPVSLIQKANDNLQKIGICINKNVCATFKTPPFDLGTNLNLKTIKGLSVVSDSETMSEYDLHLTTKQFCKSYKVVLKGSVDFGAIDFSNFYFGEPLFACVLNKALSIRNANYVQVEMEANNKNDCVVNSMTIKYEIINKKINGGIF